MTVAWPWVPQCNYFEWERPNQRSPRRTSNKRSFFCTRACTRERAFSTHDGAARTTAAIAAVTKDSTERECKCCKRKLVVTMTTADIHLFQRDCERMMTSLDEPSSWLTEVAAAVAKIPYPPDRDERESVVVVVRWSNSPSSSVNRNIFSIARGQAIVEPVRNPSSLLQLPLFRWHFRV